MKHLNHYIILGILSVLALAGCDQEHLDDTVKVQLPEHGYIFFNTELSTRATLHKDMKRNFSVMGYNWEYINQNDVWTTLRAKAKPNVFYNQKITYNSGSNLHSYTPIKSWEGGKKYAFFGYYPSQDESAGTIDTISTICTLYSLNTLLASISFVTFCTLDIYGCRVFKSFVVSPRNDTTLRYIRNKGCSILATANSLHFAKVSAKGLVLLFKFHI